MKKRYKSSRSSQAAMEFLLSYGWVIFLAMVVFSILFSSGLFNKSNLLPDLADAGRAVAVRDFVVNENSVTFVFDNVAGKPLYNFSVAVKGCNNGAGASSDPIRLGKDGKATVTVACPNAGAPFSTFNSELEVHYNERMIAETYPSTSSSTSGGDPGTYTQKIEIGLLKSKIKPGETPYGIACDVNITSCVDDDLPGYWQSGKLYCLINNINNFADTCLAIDSGGITLEGNGYTIDGLNTNGNNDFGIIATGVNNILIKNINVKEFGDYNCSNECGGGGIRFEQVGNSEILNSTTNFNGNGLSLYESSSNTLTDIAANSNARDGLIIDTSSNNIFSTFAGNSNSMTGIEFFTSNNNYLTGITAQQNNYGIKISESSNNEFYNTNANYNVLYGIYMNLASDNIIDTVASSFAESGDGVYLESSSNNHFADIVANSDFNGINLVSSSGNTFVNSILNLNSDGISLVSSNGNYFTNITVTQSTYGVHISSSSSNHFINVIADFNSNTGFYFDASPDNSLLNVTANGNTDSGVVFAYESSSNDVVNSTFNYNTGNGIWLIASLSNSFNYVTAGGNSNWDFACGGNTAQGTDNNFNKVSPCEDGWPIIGDNYGYAFDCDALISSCADDDEPGFWNLYQKTCLVANINEMSGELEEDCLHITGAGILDGLGHKIENNGYTVTGITINDGVIMQINNITVRYFTNGIKSIDRDFWYTINNSVICNNTENDILITSSTGTIDGHDNYISNIYGTYENNLQNNHSCQQSALGGYCQHNGDCTTGKCFVGDSDNICTNGLFDQPCDDNLDCEDYFMCESGLCNPES